MPGPPGGWWFSIRSVFAPQGDIQQYLEIFFKVFFFFFVMGTILKVSICYNIASGLCFDFLAPRHGGS